MKREYTVVSQLIEDGWVMATVPELPGAVTQGRTLQEAREMIKEAVARAGFRVPGTAYDPQATFATLRLGRLRRVVG